MNVKKIKISAGSASVLGLISIGKFKDSQRTCYLMTFKEGHCTANCGFCPQAKSSESSEEMLSRVNWPTFSFEKFLLKLQELHSTKKFERICIQTLKYPENFTDLKEIIIKIREFVDIPISVSIPPMSKDKLRILKNIGVQRVGIALDGATPEIFDKVKGKGVNGPYRWEHHFQKLNEAVVIFAEGFVSTHLIIGLGETEKDIIERIEDLQNLKILTSLFAFTPIKGTKFEDLSQPPLLRFRKLQLGRYLIVNKKKTQDDFRFNLGGDIVKIDISRAELINIINNTDTFLTSGCPGCDRPYYTSKPSGPIYNYPRKLDEFEDNEIYKSLSRFVN
ncbi:hypothetical protein LCGC14_1243090 [marine sediment metagenome]|uniref:Radical SAM core domain-containing protein n=1 Tax=marine sediment metagenome TaxID=412755 RepID=A0A0F9NMF0_9ZZZZ|nr:MAG: Biotin synthase [Candidatus Lokiarchaeum sp. GC14_75]